MICHYFSEPQFLFYVADLPVILYYAHIPAFIVALLVGVIVLWNDPRALLNRLLFGICVAFAVWTLGTLIAWTNIHSDILLFTWSFLGPAAGFISILSVYFAYVFLEKRDVGPWMKGVFLVLLAPLLVLAASEYTIGGFNLVNCDAFGFEGLTNTVYFPALGVLAMVWVLMLMVRAYRRAAPGFRKQIVLMGSGLELFLISFFTTVFLGQYLVTIGVLPDSQIETYGYFGMIVFMVYISIMIVRFRTFHVSLIVSQALVAALIILIASQFTYVRSGTNLILTGITLLLTTIAGIVLIRSVKKEILQRQHIERLARELEKSNQQQVILIHFITHQLKGFVTKSRNIFSMILEGDYGPVSETIKPMLEEGFRSDTKGVNTIQEILNAANIKSGRVTYAKAPVDVKELTAGIAGDLKPNADAKGLALTLNAPDADYVIQGDRMQLTNAIKNLIDNSIKYTQQGEVTVTLAREENLVRLIVADTGVGITPEDMKILFTEGGHGKDSSKVNVESTGFGLYIVKNIIEAHQGRVWAESDGAGKGSRFIAEIPVA